MWLGIAVVIPLLSWVLERTIRHQRRCVTAALAKLAKEMLPQDAIWMELEERAKDKTPPTLLELWIYNKTLNALIVSESTARAMLRQAKSDRTKADNLSE